jgi:PelA/Pel-15E family pectate lyase
MRRSTTPPDTLDRRAFIKRALAPLVLAAGCRPGAAATPTEPLEPPASALPRALAAASMLRAARFMAETVAHRGGYVWAYLPDFSRCWGELEAKRSMLWVQPPGTPSMGHALLDAFHATGDEFYYEAAEQVAQALIAAQRPSGGWNYVYDLAGRASLDEWYATVARNAWRLEEFHLHPDNSTFDDACTAVAGQFMLRMAIERGNAAYHAAFARVVELILVSQYPNGGWPQRYPLQPDYTRWLTFNDDVIGQNIKLLVMASVALGDAGLARRARAAFDCMLELQLPRPQAGWGLQHSLDGKPASARSFEPLALATHTTATNVEQLLSFYELSRDPRYLQRVPEALDWLDQVRFPDDLARRLGGTHPTFVELATNDALYVHRRGSNVSNGSYYCDKLPEPRLSHYSPARSLDVPALRSRYAELVRAPAARRSPWDALIAGVGRAASPARTLPRYFARREIQLLDLCTGREPAAPAVSEGQVRALIDALSPAGAWLAPLELVSNAYRGPSAREPFAGDTYVSTHVGDRSDTSPYAPSRAPATYAPEAAPLGISVAGFIANLTSLITYLGGGD